MTTPSTDTDSAPGRLDGNVAISTGARNIISQAIDGALAAEDARVVIHYHGHPASPPLSSALASALGVTATFDPAAGAPPPSRECPRIGVTGADMIATPDEITRVLALVAGARASMSSAS